MKHVLSASQSHHLKVCKSWFKTQGDQGLTYTYIDPICLLVGWKDIILEGDKWGRKGELFFMYLTTFNNYMHDAVNWFILVLLPKRTCHLRTKLQSFRHKRNWSPLMKSSVRHKETMLPLILHPLLIKPGETHRHNCCCEVQSTDRWTYYLQLKLLCYSFINLLPTSFFQVVAQSSVWKEEARQT